MFLQTPELKKATNNSVTNNNATPTIAIDIESRCHGENNEVCGNDIAEEVDLITRFCMPVCTRDHAARSMGLQVIEKTVMGWLDGYGSPKHSRLSSNATSVGNSVGVNDAATNGHYCTDRNNAEYVSLVTLHMPTILRLSVNCPFVDVRQSFSSILQLVQERGMPVPHPNIHGPSAYIPLEETHMLFVDAFLQNNRLDHVTQVMGYHPTYLDVFLRTQNFILRGDGPLPYDYRHFIAIMAAARHQCTYLISLQKQEFLLQGGDHTWLKGLARIPQKLRDLYEINKILAHRPWLLTKSHIEKLTKGKDSWSLAEVVHAIVLLAHFHCLSSFVFGCGVNEELDQDGGHHNGSSDSAPPLGSSPRSVPSPTPLTTAPCSKDGEPWLASMSPVEQEVGVDMLMQRMKSLSERSEEFSQEEKTKRFEHVENQSVELSPGLEPLMQVKADIGHFVDDPTFLYQDFARRGGVSDIPTFRVQDYSWDDHGYSLVNRLYNDVGNLLDEKFKTASNLTYYTMGGRKDVDTSRFRRAIWNYIQCMYGIRHDDYDYGEVNQLLEKSLKTFIKSVCCYPERVTKKDYDRVLREFRHSEKVHVNLMVLEARMQAELLYALRAIMNYMT